MCAAAGSGRAATAMSIGVLRMMTFPELDFGHEITPQRGRHRHGGKDV
jgi:hypothetical protein